MAHRGASLNGRTLPHGRDYVSDPWADPGRVNGGMGGPLRAVTQVALLSSVEPDTTFPNPSEKQDIHLGAGSWEGGAVGGTVIERYRRTSSRSAEQPAHLGRCPRPRSRRGRALPRRDRRDSPTSPAARPGWTRYSSNPRSWMTRAPVPRLSPHETEQQVLRPDVGVVGLQRLPERELEDLLRPRRERRGAPPTPRPPSSRRRCAPAPAWPGSGYR